MIVGSSTAVPFASAGPLPRGTPLATRPARTVPVLDAEFVSLGTAGEERQEIVLRSRGPKPGPGDDGPAFYGPDGRGRSLFVHLPGRLVTLVA